MKRRVGGLMVSLFLANGFEEVEAITPWDYLKRAGIHVVSVGINGKKIRGAHQINIQTDITLSELDYRNTDMIILPGGGEGTKNLASNQEVLNAISYCAQHKSVAAICAAPYILGELGLLKGYKATCFPGFESKLLGATVVQDQSVVVDQNIITSKGAGAAQLFSFAIIEYLLDGSVANQIRTQVQHP